MEYINALPANTVARFATVLESAAETVLKALQKIQKPGETERTGGIICVFMVSGPLTVSPLCLVFGKVSAGDALRYQYYAMEKVRRLAEHPEHVASAQSANDDLHKFQGAIRAGNWFIGVSGLPAAADEILAILVALGMGWITNEEADAFAALTGNNFYFGPDQLVQR